VTTSSPGRPGRPTPGRSTGALPRPSLGPASPPLQLGAVLWRSLPGRLVLLCTGLLLLLLAAGLVVDLPFAFDLLRRIAWISWLVGLAWLAGLAVINNRHVILWRVRRKLLLSYVFFGVVPVVLVLAFGLAASVLLYVTVAKYVFLESYADSARFVRDVAEVSATEVGRTSVARAANLEQRYENLRERFPGLSLALVPAPGQATGAAVSAGAWEHMPAPTSLPAWVAQSGPVFTTLAWADATGTPGLVIRAVVPTADGVRFAVVDLPVDQRFARTLHEQTGITMEVLSITGCDVSTPPATAPGDGWTVFRETVALVDCRKWDSGETGRVSFALVAPVRDLYASLAAFNLTPDEGALANWPSVLLQLLWMLGFLFLIIQASAIVMGALLARSITSAVHELFEGTERVREGDFAHRIRIESNDQLGALSESFNRMSSSIERLLHVEREKQRLDDELRIARQIQKSLLPMQPPEVPGLDIADYCEPARAVGGDYYDFFHLSASQIGVMIADVSGKGTSAALYMAELKGIMLALSRAERSPRNVLIELNRLLAAHLDNRSFITMTYAVVDLERRVVTVARAGHTPLIRAAGGTADLVQPDGIVLGLRLPGAEAKFAEVLREVELPIVPGDVLVLYTDGISDATDTGGELFGDERLAQLVKVHADLGAGGIRERVVRDIAAFVGDAEPHDDMTMVVMKVVSAERA
jgi:sigma-B regulation protein RsbU (phosphoserine phosphatase)